MNYKETELSVLENLTKGLPGNQDLQFSDNDYYDLLFSMKAGGLIDFEKSDPGSDYNFDQMTIKVTSYGIRFLVANKPPTID